MASDNPHENGRRRFCQACIGGMAALSAGMVGFPVVSFLGRTEHPGADKPLEVPIGQMSPGQVQYVEFHGEQLIVLATSDGTSVFSASCPHLGCNVSWDTAESVFRCPCHGAIFSATGEVMSGPVSSPLKQIPFEAAEGKIIIT